MEFRGIQIAISVIVILGAAAVALLCDFLKRKNEQLREAMVELQLRREQETLRAANPMRRSGPERKPVVSAPVQAVEQAVTPELVMDAPVVDRATATVVAKVAANHRRANGRVNGASNGHSGYQDAAADTLVRKPNSTARVARPQFDAAELTSVRGRRPVPPPSVTESLPKADEMNSKEALADWLSRRAAARAAQVAQTTEQTSANPETRATETLNPVMQASELAPVDATPVHIASEPIVEATAATTLSSTDVFGLPEVQIDAFLWESLVSGKPTPSVLPEFQLQLIRSAASTSHELVVPAGMHDQSFLARLLEINKPFTGLVLSIGVNENDGSTPRSEDLMRSATNHIASLLGEKDFGCQTGTDEFILICSGEKGAEAQRRLSNISERLWDFQLRGLGSFSIMFSWGGVDVQGEPLSDAVNSATERMYQTKRSRKTVSMDSVSNRRKAV